jgi:hypothetical protein
VPRGPRLLRDPRQIRQVQDRLVAPNLNEPAQRGDGAVAADRGRALAREGQAERTDVPSGRNSTGSASAPWLAAAVSRPCRSGGARRTSAGCASECPPVSDMIARRLTELEEVTLASPRYIEEHGMPRHPNDLRQGHLMVGFHSSATGGVRPLEFTVDKKVSNLFLPWVMNPGPALLPIAALAAVHIRKAIDGFNPLNALDRDFLLFPTARPAAATAEKSQNSTLVRMLPLKAFTPAGPPWSLGEAQSARECLCPQRVETGHWG